MLNSLKVQVFPALNMMCPYMTPEVVMVPLPEEGGEEKAINQNTEFRINNSIDRFKS